LVQTHSDDNNNAPNVGWNCKDGNIKFAYSNEQFYKLFRLSRLGFFIQTNKRIEFNLTIHQKEKAGFRGLMENIR
jgi:hypothetical protein